MFSFFLLGFEIDTLEIHLRETYEFVDMYCIAEGTRSHWNQTMKPLMWDRVKYTDRFAFVQEKVFHIVQHDGNLAKFGLKARPNVWDTEIDQTQTGVAACGKVCPPPDTRGGDGGRGRGPRLGGGAVGAGCWGQGRPFCPRDRAAADCCSCSVTDSRSDGQAYAPPPPRMQ